MKKQSLNIPDLSKATPSFLKELSSLYGKKDVDIKDLKQIFPEAEIAHELALSYSPELFKYVVYEWNLGSGAYGVYSPKQSFDLTGDIANIVYEHRENEAEALKENKHGITFGVNIKGIVQDIKKRTLKNYQSLIDSGKISHQEMEKIWRYFAILEIASTMVHEATHANGGNESAAIKSEQSFLSWANQRKEKLMSHLGLSKKLDVLLDFGIL